MYPKNRLDALTDGIFAVAMTLLVLDLHIPEETAVGADEASLLRALAALSPKLLPYLLSFYVLGVSWLSLIKARSRGETVGEPYAKWSLFYLLFVTLVPFSTVLMGRFTSHATATVLYAANIGAIALIAFVLMSLLPDPVRDAHWLDRRVSLLLLLASCLLTMALSFVVPGQALWAFALNVGGGLLVRLYRWLAPAG
ncbi:TMEM175 family protein [Variovorax sp. H27-G14]|uniref:TMEM175 family protein n=1 Tax=Variovorax sp. H27-G14 TaxID=3111914 RepID=UPI0038FCA22C